MTEHLNSLFDSIAQVQNEANIITNRRTFSNDHELESKSLLFSNAMKCAREGNLIQLIRHLDYYKSIYSKDFDINQRQINGNGRTLLQEASMYGNMECVEWILTRDNVNVNKISLVGKETALHYACSNHHLSVVLALLRHGANPNQRNKWNFSVLDYCQSEQPIMNLLLSFRSSRKTCSKHR